MKENKIFKQGVPFTEVEVDSILSKLIQGRYYKKKFVLATESLLKADSYITTLEKEVLTFKEIVETDEQMKRNMQKYFEDELKLQKKKTFNVALKWGGIGIGIGVIITAIIL